MSTTPSVIDSTPAMPAMPSGGGANAEDRFTASLSSALSADSEPSQAEPDETTSNDSTAELSTEAETSEDSAVATAPADAETEPDPYADEDDADPKVIEQFLKTPRGREIHQGYKFVKELSKPSAEGGIGHVPSVQDVRQYFTSHRANVQMYADFSSGDPARMGQFISHWFGPKGGQAALTAISALEPTLAQFGPDAYGAMAAPVMARYEGALIEKWKAATDPNMKEALYKAAQLIHFDTHDEWLPDSVFTGDGNGANAASRTTQAERSQIAGEWQRLNQAKLQGQREAENAWNSKLGEAETATLSAEIDKALKPLTDMKAKTPEVYESIKERFAKQISTAAAADPQVWALYQARVEQARRNGANPEEVAKTLLPVIVAAIASKRKTFLQGAGIVIKQNSDDKHAQLRRIASNTAPSNTGSPVQKSVVPSTLKRPGESREQYYERRMIEASR